MSAINCFVLRSYLAELEGDPGEQAARDRLAPPHSGVRHEANQAMTNACNGLHVSSATSLIRVPVCPVMTPPGATLMRCQGRV
ncbi:MAG TPA: hypothetical protein VNN06_12690, partial [Ramlibacter sp.]|nr:hypothetical protein [Ramlibacter sp.]